MSRDSQSCRRTTPYEVILGNHSRQRSAREMEVRRQAPDDRRPFPASSLTTPMPMLSPRSFRPPSPIKRSTSEKVWKHPDSLLRVRSAYPTGYARSDPRRASSRVSNLPQRSDEIHWTAPPVRDPPDEQRGARRHPIPAQVFPPEPTWVYRASPAQALAIPTPPGARRNAPTLPRPRDRAG